MSAHNNNDSRNLFYLALAASILLLLMHFYYYCYGAFSEWKLTRIITDRILENISKTGLFINIFFSKLWALLFVVIAAAGIGGQKDNKPTYESCGLFIASGITVYFLSYFFLRSDDISIAAILYMGSTMTGYLLILAGCVRLSRILPSPFRDNDPFGRDLAGFPQEQRLLHSDFSINLPARYLHKEKQRDSWINIINSRRGILIMGSPGCGKSWFIIEPIIYQLIEKQFALFIFDFKYPVLTHFARHHFKQHYKSYPSGSRFYSINFSDASSSHRCNILDPDRKSVV